MSAAAGAPAPPFRPSASSFAATLAAPGQRRRRTAEGGGRGGRAMGEGAVGAAGRHPRGAGGPRR
eukprot:gene587-15880_t